MRVFWIYPWLYPNFGYIPGYICFYIPKMANLYPIYPKSTDISSYGYARIYPNWRIYLRYFSKRYIQNSMDITRIYLHKKRYILCRYIQKKIYQKNMYPFWIYLFVDISFFRYIFFWLFLFSGVSISGYRYILFWIYPSVYFWILDNEVWHTIKLEIERSPHNY